MIENYKIQDFGTGLDGRQEDYWDHKLRPKYERLRPGFKFKFKTPEALAKQHKFVAFEFGHWTNQNERFDFLAAADASFNDIKKVTGLKTLGLNKIGVAYGARGKGGSALAHFEPWSFMINLTKSKGLGAFAHEYGHAIDYFFGGYVDQDPASFALSGGRLTYMNDVNKYPGRTLRQLMAKVITEIIWEKPGKKSKSYLAFCEIGGNYWIQRNEIFARAFEQWVHHVLGKKKIRNNFLTFYKYDSPAYLTPGDFKRVLPHMNALIKAIAAKSR